MFRIQYTNLFDFYVDRQQGIIGAYKLVICMPKRMYVCINYIIPTQSSCKLQ